LGVSAGLHSSVELHGFESLALSCLEDIGAAAQVERFFCDYAPIFGTDLGHITFFGGKALLAVLLYECLLHLIQTWLVFLVISLRWKTFANCFPAFLAAVLHNIVITDAMNARSNF
jgi:hypothetical protein